MKVWEHTSSAMKGGVPQTLRISGAGLVESTDVDLKPGGPCRAWVVAACGSSLRPLPRAPWLRAPTTIRRPPASSGAPTTSRSHSKRLRHAG